MTPAEYEEILKHQGGVCYICQRPPKEGKHLAVDHDHRLGFIRGLLCGYDNRIISLFHDNPAKLQRASTYISEPPAFKVIGKRQVIRHQVVRKGKPGFYLFSNDKKPKGQSATVYLNKRREDKDEWPKAA